MQFDEIEIARHDAVLCTGAAGGNDGRAIRIPAAVVVAAGDG